MKRFVISKSILCLVIAFTLAAAFTGGILLRGGKAAHASSQESTKSHFCANLNKHYWGSSGAQMYCFGSQPNGPAHATGTSPSVSANVNAANPAEDRSPAGVQFYGQSETSIASVGSYVVEAWNDSTAFGSPCLSPGFKEELTGYGFSNNGGASFKDEGGLPNNNCGGDTYNGDPTVEAWRAGGTPYFYIGSLYNPPFSAPDQRSKLALAACAVNGSGSSATISCSQPIVVASSSQCQTSNGFTFCSFLDKEFLTIDPVHGRLYMSYTEFSITSPGTIEELAVCDIGTPTGGTGPAGGKAGVPVCFSGARGSVTAPSAPYLVIAPPDTVNGCENEGSYPAVDVATGDLYVAFEHNSFAIFGSCGAQAVQEVVNYVPASCLTLPAASCSGPVHINTVSIISLQAAFIPGYNRFPMNDFPRIAVSDAARTVSIVWNDARFHLAGDILLQSFNLRSLTRVQTASVRINSSTGGWHMLPALRNADASGNLNISFYGRSSATTAVTNVYVALAVNPRTGSTPANILVTTVATNWLNVSSDIVPNFGDYTDNFVIATPNAPFTGSKLYIAWSDGRIGEPQPFEAHTQV